MNKKLPTIRQNLAVLQEDYNARFDEWYKPPMAMDAQSTLNMSPNAGVPVMYTTETFNEITRAIVTPARASKIYGERQAGDWTSTLIQFPFVESTGTISAYDDYSQNAQSNANMTWEVRQPWLYQTWAEWGEREIDMAAKGNFSIIAEKEIASANILNKAQNLIYLFGVQGIRNYGALNDPDLPPSIQPTLKTGGALSWKSTTDPLEIYNDFLKLFGQLNDQMSGNLSMDDPLVVVVPNGLQQCLAYKNEFGLRIREMLKEDFPNLRIEALPEAGDKLSNGKLTSNMMQMFVETYQGMQTVFCGFTYKMRGHRMENYSSYQRQKKSQGSWGTVWRFPVACASMVGI
ncbi:unnamed protein product [Commensalibacter communis]|uniref:DUF2184 domain-containing protein n=1 Tax=Commensalibacter communis TaxID=2972786 RepID=A0A9W4TPG1_9PROT|nr:hypothetical protein [Commensalibacter communis]CAI3941870.1 unnamed protein product [Commensalibacter communis]CAI3944768.1 unnamed protein product [Commensalibacter communis]CAI3958973.1 unnamed protein product [Commensalibacter communis]CAI3961069.1 unnamed protein product [Commensalibacter communis]